MKRAVTGNHPCINLCILLPHVQQPTTHRFVEATSDLVILYCIPILEFDSYLVTPARPTGLIPQRVCAISNSISLHALSNSPRAPNFVAHTPSTLPPSPVYQYAVSVE